MAQKLYFVDACIWLNLFKKEGDETKGVPYWKIAKDFFEKVIFSEEYEIYYSGFVLKEIKYILNNKTLFEEKSHYMKDEPKFHFEKATPEDYDLARKLESEFEFTISFFDCTHIAISKRLKCTLITRDKELISAAIKYVKVKKPEELIS